MKNVLLFFLALSPLVVLADTPAPGTVKAKMYSGDGLTPITATSGAIDVHISNSGGLSTVDQGAAGSDPWLVNVTSSVLPTNACAEDGGHLASIDEKLSTPMPVSGTFWQTTQPVSLASLPALASGSNTIGAVNVNGTVPVSGTVAGSGTFLVDGSAHTQPVSGSVTVDAGSGVFQVDASGFTVPVSGTFWQATQPVSGTFWQTTQPVSGTFWQATQPVSAASLPLPSGASTESTQLDVKTNTGAAATSVASIDTKTPALGQALAAGSVPVVLTASQLSTLTPFSTVTANAGSGTFLIDGSAHTQPVSGTFWQATQPVSGTVTVNIGTSGSLALDSSVTGLQVSQGSTTSGQKGALSLGAVTTSAPSYTNAQSSPFSLTTAGALRVDASSTTQPVSGTFWQATQPVSGTFWQATQPVSGTFWQATQPVSLSTLPALTAGSAIIGKVGIDQTTPGTTNGVQVNAALPAGSNVIGHVIVDTAPSTPVTNTGTFAVQATPVVPTATTVKQAAVTIGTSAVRLTTDGSAPSSTRTLLAAQLLSSSTANCYFGSSGVTSSSTTRGVQMFAGQVFSFNNDAGDYYAICDASSQTFLITEQE